MEADRRASGAVIVSLPAVKKWLNGSHVPFAADLEIIGEARAAATG
jgi:hypothetical protein